MNQIHIQENIHRLPGMALSWARAGGSVMQQVHHGTCISRFLVAHLNFRVLVSTRHSIEMTFFEVIGLFSC